jgi:hypothetical protein
LMRGPSVCCRPRPLGSHAPADHCCPMASRREVRTMRGHGWPAGVQQEAPQQRPPGVQPPGGGRPTRRRAPARPCILGWHDVLRVGRRRTPRPCRMTCPLHRLATTTPTSWWSVSMPPGWRGSVLAAMRPLIGAIALAGGVLKRKVMSTNKRRWQPDQHLQIERIPARRLNRYPWPRRSDASWGNGQPHSGYRHLADKDEVPGSSPGRPTTNL